MSATRAYVWLFIGSIGLLAGCAGSVRNVVAELDGRSKNVELVDVPFHSQVTDQCGPAALATVLNHSGIAVTPQDLKSRVYIPGRQGALQLELLSAARQYGRVPYEVDPTVVALVAELDAGRPVLVLQNLATSFAPIWHYAVVVGYLPDERQFVLRSGDRPRHLVRATAFARSWKHGGYWGFVVLEAGELPTNPDAGRYLRAVAAVESAGSPASAAAAYRVATTRWPENRLAWLGLGNASFGVGAMREAEGAYQQALTLSPRDAVALNNLAQVYLQQGCREKALATIDSGIAATEGTDPLRSQLLATRDEILDRVRESHCR